LISMADRLQGNEEFQELIQPLLGLTVSLPWKGYGSAIFLELGALAPLELPRQHHNEGEACIFISWDWRVEGETAVLYGSSNSGPKMEAGILSLQGETVQAVTIEEPVPELVVQFSNGHRLRTMAMRTGAPEWSIKLLDERWIYTHRGHLLVGNGAISKTEQEKAVFARAERTAARWGIPSVEPKRGSCAKCSFFVRLDGEGGSLDYGCCTAEAGPFDGRVVSQKSGCPAFAGDTET
jgi:hypothetical protein